MYSDFNLVFLSSNYIFEFPGFLFWIDYMVNPELPPPPLITTVKPLPINPKQLWEQDKSPDLERNLLEVETSAMEYVTAREEKQHAQEEKK